MAGLATRGALTESDRFFAMQLLHLRQWRGEVDRRASIPPHKVDITYAQ